MRHCFSVKKANDDEGCFGTKGSLAIMVHHAQAFLARDDAENGESDKMELLRTELTLCNSRTSSRYLRHPEPHVLSSGASAREGSLSPNSLQMKCATVFRFKKAIDEEACYCTRDRSAE
jgi:hypothetical protein